MPAQKRSFESASPNERDDPLLRDHEHPEDEVENGEDSDESPESSGGDKDEFVLVKLSEIRREVQCPICLGIIRKTRTVMECLHRFCRECIDKSMRLGNNECPACRKHCASRRSLRDDPNYDALIAALYPDIDKYEEEELAFHEEEKARNKQIQASIAQTLRRQTEALGRKRSTPKTEFRGRSPGSNRNWRRRRNYRVAEHQGSDEDEDANGHDGGKDSSSAGEPSAEVKPKRCKRWTGARFSHPSSAAASADGGGDEDDSEVNKDVLGASAGLVGTSEMLAWGKGGIRSHSRHGSLSGGSCKHGRSTRLSKLIDTLRNSAENHDGWDVHLVLVSVDEENIPSLQRPYLCCRQTVSVKHLCQFVALQTETQEDVVEMMVVKKLSNESRPLTNSISNFKVKDLCEDELCVLQEHETLAGLRASYHLNEPYLFLAYRLKPSGLGTS